MKELQKGNAMLKVVIFGLSLALASVAFADEPKPTERGEKASKDSGSSASEKPDHEKVKCGTGPDGHPIH